jgi:hypothetical protein
MCPVDPTYPHMRVENNHDWTMTPDGIDRRPSARPRFPGRITIRCSLSAVLKDRRLPRSGTQRDTIVGRHGEFAGPGFGIDRRPRHKSPSKRSAMIRLATADGQQEGTADLDVLS